MVRVELYAKVRHAVMVEGLSRREAARRFGVHRNTVTKMLSFSVPPGYRRRERPVSKKLGPHMAWIDAILEGDSQVHKKQRHTAHRIFELRDEQGFTGGYTIVREYVAKAMLGRREMFVPLSHRPGHAQADFGEADGYIGGKKVRFHYFCMDLPHSDGCFVKAYPAETAEAFCDGHVAAFDFFGGVPRSILYDNTRLAVSKIVKGWKRLRSKMFAELQSHYLFEDRFGRPGKGNDKGKVEGLVGFVRRNFMTPLPVAESLDAFNAGLRDACTKRGRAILRGHTLSIAERVQADLAAFMKLPAAPYDVCDKITTRVSSLSLVRYKNNDYSVPVRFGHQEVLAKGYVDRVEIVCRDETIAVHRRSYERADFIYNPLHYLALLEHKTKALDQAAPLDDWRLADCIHRLRRLMEARRGVAGRREFIQVLRLMEDFHQHQVEQAVREALRLGAISFDAVKMLLLARLEDRPARLNLTLYPYLPAATVGTTDPRAYLALIAAWFLWQRGHEHDDVSRATAALVAPQILLSNHLKALKLPTFAREYEKVGKESAQDRADYPRFLLRLCELERIDRERRNVERRIRLARFPQTKSFDTFDFSAQPSLNKALVLELIRCEWIDKRENCIALGPSGTGKTHVALGLGLACQKGYSVAFTTAAALVHELMEARDERRLRALQKQLNTVKLLIVDELGYVPVTAVGSELLFEVFSQRYERGSTIVTSNLPFDEWTSIFGSERLTGALLDRLTHHVNILEMNGESYRLAASKKAQRRSAHERSQNPKTPKEGDPTTKI